MPPSSPIPLKAPHRSAFKERDRRASLKVKPAKHSAVPIRSCRIRRPFPPPRGRPQRRPGRVALPNGVRALPVPIEGPRDGQRRPCRPTEIAPGTSAARPRLGAKPPPRRSVRLADPAPGEGPIDRTSSKVSSGIAPPRPALALPHPAAVALAADVPLPPIRHHPRRAHLNSHRAASVASRARPTGARTGAFLLEYVSLWQVLR